MTIAVDWDVKHQGKQTLQRLFDSLKMYSIVTSMLTAMVRSGRCPYVMGLLTTQYVMTPKMCLTHLSLVSLLWDIGK